MENVASIGSGIEVEEIRKLFPILHQKINGHDLVYFDNAATTQKPVQVLDALQSYYTGYNANIHRGIHTLAERATTAFEQTRTTAASFLNAGSKEEIIFVRGVTEAINLVASSYGRSKLQKGDEVILSGLEHHSNIVPWQLVAEEKQCHIKVIPVTDTGELDLQAYRGLLNERTRIVSVNHASNSLGTINPVKEIIRLAHQAGAVALIDGAQAAPHLPIDVQDLDCDFYCISGHKMYGPTGVGVLYGKKKILEAMPPYMGGGEMIRQVTFEKTTWNDLPYKFEAGTPNIADVVALKSAFDFISGTGKDAMAQHEHMLLRYATERLSELNGLRVVGNSTNKVSVLSFVIEGIHPFDIGQMLDTRGIAVRTGHHCTQPLMDRMGLEGTVRASFAVYNTRKETDRLVEGLQRVIGFLK